MLPVTENRLGEGEQRGECDGQRWDGEMEKQQPGEPERETTHAHGNSPENDESDGRGSGAFQFEEREKGDESLEERKSGIAECKREE